jgi:DEAD/DEAH box helicase domain-containing protein
MYGSEPTFVAASATAANAEEHLRNLSNLDLNIIKPDEDGSKQGRKTYFLCQPVGYNPIDAATRLTIKLVQEGTSVLTFCPSRTSAEKKFYAAIKMNPSLSGKMAVYRAGLRADERERIEAGLKNGSIRGVFSTSALELGVDIGMLDVCILVGFPPTMMSMWQRSGRVGRGGKEGAIVVVASDGLVDNYFLHHQDEFFARENERLVATLTNETILVGHFACAKKEVNGDYQNLHANIFGPEFAEIMQRYKEQQLEHGILYSDSPHSEVNIRNIDDFQYSIVCGNEELGDISGQQILREAYEGAVYYHAGQRYRVKHIIQGERRVRVEPEPTSNDTRPNVRVSIEKGKPHHVQEWDSFRIGYGPMKVRQSIASYFEYTDHGRQLGQFPTRPRTREFPTLGFWLELHPQTVSALSIGSNPAKLAAGLHGVEHVLSGLLPVIVPCDPNDYDAQSSAKAGEPAVIYIYDNVHGGIGLSQAGYTAFSDLVNRAYELIHDCSCEGESGCPNCVQSSRCFNFTDLVNKAEAIRLLQALKNWISANAPQVKDFEANMAGHLALAAAADSIVPADADKEAFVGFSSGSFVKHEKFGIGKVLGNSTGPTSAKILVDFGGKKLSVACARFLKLVTGEEVIVRRQCGTDDNAPGAHLCKNCGSDL